MVEGVQKSGLRCMGHELREEDDEPVKRVWDLEVDDIRGEGRPKISWKEMMKKESSTVGPQRKHARDKKRRREGVPS